MKLLEFAEKEFLFRAIESPTRFREVFTKYPDNVSSVQMLAPLGKGDHVVVLLELQIQLQEDKQLPSFRWFCQKTRRSGLVEAATMVNW